MLKLTIPADIADEVIAQAKQGLPLEVCGILAGNGDCVEKLYKMTNTDESNVHYAMDSQEQFAAVELFRGNMLRHSAVVYHADLPEPAQAIDFDGDGWLDYIPIPVSGTIVVEERLPAGAAAVLINRAHTQTDIYLPIDTNQKRLFDTIDGERSIRDLVGDRGDLSAARTLFERLWQYDQVVFDTSRQPRGGGSQV